MHPDCISYLQELLLVCQDMLINSGAAGHSTAGQNTKSTVEDLEKSLSLVGAEADAILRSKVSALEGEKLATRAPPTPPLLAKLAKLLEDELRAQITSLERQLRSTEGTLENSERALRAVESQLQSAKKTAAAPVVGASTGLSADVPS